MKLTARKFLRRFFLHVLPKGFVRIRHFGLLANRFRNQNLALARQLITNTEPQKIDIPNTVPQQQRTLWHCPRCGSAMCVTRRLTTQEINSS
jgi:hypothetical protein